MTNLDQSLTSTACSRRVVVEKGLPYLESSEIPNYALLKAIFILENVLRRLREIYACSLLWEETKLVTSDVLPLCDSEYRWPDCYNVTRD